MYPRFANELRATGDGLLPAAVVAAIALLLAGCGSSPSIPESQQEQVGPAPAEQPPAAQTFPLEGDAAQPAQSAAVPDQAPAPSATSAQPAKAVPANPSAATATPEPPLPPEAVQQFDNAVAMVNSGNLAAAEEAFRALGTAYPAYSGPLVNLGILQAKAGRLADAEQTLKQAIERRPDNATAHNQLGIVYRRQGRFGDAEQAYTRAVQIDPNYANAHLNLGVLCDLYLQQPQRALEAFERYLSLTATPDEKVAAWVKELKVRLENAQRGSGA
jgi:Flp pilus assembly protein TadD